MADNRIYNQTQRFTLSSSISLSDTTITLTSLNFPDGTAITASDIGTVNYATIEPGTSREEQVSFTGISGTSLTGVTRGLKFTAPYDQDTGLRIAHAAGAILVFSNTAAYYDNFANKNNDETITQTWTYTNPLFPKIDDDTTDPTDDEQFATKGYVDRTASGTPVSKDREVIAGNAGETLAAGDFVYLDDADSEWKKTDGTDATTIDGQKIGIAQGAGTDGNAISGGVLTSGLDDNQTGLTANNVYFLADVAGTIATSAGTTERAIGISISTTEVVFDPYFKDYVTGDEKDSLEAANGTLSTSNAVMSQTGYQRAQEIYAASSAGSDTYAITLSPVPAAYATGMVVNFEADVANTGAATLNVNTLGAITIKKHNDQDLETGDIEIGQIVTVVYDGTNFQMQSQTAVAPLTGSFNKIQATGLGTASASTGSTAEQTLFTTSIAGNTVGTTGGLRITWSGDYVKNTDNVTIRVKLGSTTFYDVTLTATASELIGEHYIMNNASATAQNARGYVSLGSGSTSVLEVDRNTTGTEDTTGALSLAITSQFADTNTSTFSLDNVVVELLQ